MLKPGKFLRTRLSEIESEGTFDTFTSALKLSLTNLGGFRDFWGGKSPLTALE